MIWFRVANPASGRTRRSPASLRRGTRGGGIDTSSDFFYSESGAPVAWTPNAGANTSSPTRAWMRSSASLRSGVKVGPQFIRSGLRDRGVGAALHPFDSFVLRLHLPQPEAGDQFLHLGERAVDYGPVRSGELDAHPLELGWSSSAASSTPALASSSLYFPITPLHRDRPCSRAANGLDSARAHLLTNAGREKNISLFFAGRKRGVSRAFEVPTQLPLPPIDRTYRTTRRQICLERI
jgi:hypothetical protein